MRQQAIILACVLAGMATSAGSNHLQAENIIFFRGTTYAAIAYSEKTGEWGYSSGQQTRDIAEELARRNCKADDAKPVAFVRNGFCALAVGENGAWGTGFSYGDGASNTAAKNKALAECE